jgi:hypothetical protein
LDAARDVGHASFVPHANLLVVVVVVGAVPMFVACGASGGGDATGPNDAGDASSNGDAAIDTSTSTKDSSTIVDAKDASDATHDAAVDAMPSCPPLAGAHYDWVGITTAPSPTPSEVHPDINLLLRTWRPAAGEKNAIFFLSHPTDPVGPPHLDTLFTTPRVPTFPDVSQAQLWDWGCHCFTGYITDPPVTILGMSTTSGEVLHVPKSGYTIDPPDFAAMVLWAAPDTITLKYDTGDNIGVPNGYALMFAGVCVDPQLVASYESAVSTTGRKQLPGLHRGQAFGYAAGVEIQVAVRDSGSWMDPRWCNDWWSSCP